MRYTGFPQRVKDIVASRSGGMCELHAVCGPGAELHHRRPRAAGGTRRASTSAASNAFLLCLDAHRWVENNRDEARECGWLVRQEHEPLTTPVLYRGVSVLLDDHGNIYPEGEAA